MHGSAAAGMTVERLDREYNLRRRWPQHVDFFAAYARDSAAARRRLSHRRDVAYGPHPCQRLDLFPAIAPDGRAVPVLAFLHGGYWQALGKDDFSFVASGFVDAGIAVAVVGYPLCPQTRFADLVEAVSTVVGWLHASGAAHGCDPDRVFVAGHSAGGHLAAWLATADWGARGLPADAVKGACAISGIFDLAPIRRCYLNAVLGLDDATAEHYSPIRHIPERAPPLVVAVGADETQAFLGQQADFVDAWRARGHEARIVDMPCCHHFDVVQALAMPESPLHRAVRDLVRPATHDRRSR